MAADDPDNPAATKGLAIMLYVISCFLLNFWPQLCAAVDSNSHRSVDQVGVIDDLTVSDGREPWPSPALRADLEASSSAEAFMSVPSSSGAETARDAGQARTTRSWFRGLTKTTCNWTGVTELLKSSTTTRSWFGGPRGALVKLQHPGHFLKTLSAVKNPSQSRV